MSERNISPINEAILEIVGDLRGVAVSEATAEKITMRILGERARAKPEPLGPEDVRALRERAHMSQAVFARVLNVTPGYIAQIERGAKRATGAALAMLHVIRRKGIEAVL